MGHRANFVVIEHRVARVFADQWAALECALVLQEGPAASRKWVEALEEAGGLMPSGFAEAGFLLDFDEVVMMGFGDVGADLQSLDEESAACAAALNRDPAKYLRHVARVWPGWKLIWDERGLAAFAKHLRKRDIEGIDLDLVEAASANYAVITVSVDKGGKVTSSKRLRSAARKRRDEEANEPAAEPDLNDDWAGVMYFLPDVGFMSRSDIERHLAEARPPWDVARTRAVCEQLLAEGELLQSADGLALAQNNGMNRDLLARMERQAKAAGEATPSAKATKVPMKR
ncbi:hypothetical protein SAMN02745121_05659 [Nannocystis exedens]|uniref:Uncharacterized protein n=1 Tax=Nannocystis exedens TaxID=54 RepID=A0A1I2DPU8_9BACT|nr:hypothetical protein [Nannocystis exedens]PCC69008.1 hypothetical protein NAEX_02030 [Nannocystis exedens]SFE82361.1 hypothetical protein SAMN02745121_05659 [Nannocystis exedens]